MNSYGERLLAASMPIGKDKYKVPSKFVNDLAKEWALKERGWDVRRGTYSSLGVYPL